MYSYYLVMDKIATTPNISDILVSNVTDGFIEMVVADSQVDGTEYLETKLHRCNENSRFNMTRYMKCLPFTPSILVYKGIAPPTFVTQSSLQRHIGYGGHSEQVGSKRGLMGGMGISRNKGKRVLKKLPKLLKKYFGQKIL